MGAIRNLLNVGGGLARFTKEKKRKFDLKWEGGGGGVSQIYKMEKKKICLENYM
jgi:hypothetical protein